MFGEPAMAFRPEVMVSFTHPGCPASLDHEALANLGKEGKEGGRDLDLHGFTTAHWKILESCGFGIL